MYFEVENADGGFKKKRADKISDRNQACHSVSSDAECTCIMGGQLRDKQ